jgi:hypothetical protein
MAITHCGRLAADGELDRAAEAAAAVGLRGMRRINETGVGWNVHVAISFRLSMDGTKHAPAKIARRDQGC